MTLIQLLARSTFAAAPTDPPNVVAVPEVAQVVAGDIRITALRTGWVRVKRPHQEFHGVGAFRFPAIIAARNWGPWMPIISYVVEHPERTVMLDTGASPNINDADYFSCHRPSEWFYGENLRFHTGPDEALGARLAVAGIDAASVDDVLVSHFHGDHVGGFGDVPRAVIWTGPGNLPKHVGSFTCRLPEDRPVRDLSWAPDAAGVFAGAQALTSDGRVQAVRLEGHTPGHIGIRVQTGGGTWLLVGDATFDRDQTERGAVTGAAQDLRRSRETQAVLGQLWAGGAVVLPAHDATAFERLEASVADRL